MLYYTHTQTEYPSVDAFKLAHIDTSFGDLYNREYRESVGLFDILEAEPEYDRELQIAMPAGVLLVNGNYVREYTIGDRQLTNVEVERILIARYEAALTAHLDATAQSKRYDNRITCALRAGYSGPFQAEGAAFAAWMDQCNALGYQMLAEIQAGTRPMFSDTAAFIAEMPAMVWPS